ncbi:MAG: hypothetical protein ACHRXM_03570 [Isosphaerales bacterium]
MTHLEDFPLAATLLENGPDLNGCYGSPSKLVDLLTTLAGQKVAASPRWPKSPSCLIVELRRISAQLRLHGILVKLSRCHKGRVASLLSRDP